VGAAGFLRKKVSRACHRKRKKAENKQRKKTMKLFHHCGFVHPCFAFGHGGGGAFGIVIVIGLVAFLALALSGSNSNKSN
jgi:uncharacterized membrane protein YfcA